MLKTCRKIEHIVNTQNETALRILTRESTSNPVQKILRTADVWVEMSRENLHEVQFVFTHTTFYITPFLHRFCSIFHILPLKGSEELDLKYLLVTDIVILVPHCRLYDEIYSSRKISHVQLHTHTCPHPRTRAYIDTFTQF